MGDWRKIRPRGNRILMQLDESPHTFGNGMLIFARVPDIEGDYRLYPQRGIVLACGPDVVDLVTGDLVVATKYNGVRLPEREWSGPGGSKLVLIKEDFIYLTIHGDGEIKYGRSFVNDPRAIKRGAG